MERQRRADIGGFVVACAHRPRTQVRKAGEERDGDDVEQAGVGLGVVSRNGDKEGDFADKRGEPWTRVEKLGG